MKNYLMLNNKQIELSPEQVEQIEESFGFNKTQLKDVAVGDTFKVGDLEFIVLEHKEYNPGNCETFVILKDFWKADKFDESSNDYKESSIRKSLNTEFYALLSNAVESKNIVKHNVDLTADDGRTDYGTCKDNISLLTCEMYRKYVYILDERNPEKWWWLSTPWSTPHRGWTLSVRCVSGFGTLSNCRCDGIFGVRPFCILKSNIFVSK